MLLPPLEQYDFEESVDNAVVEYGRRESEKSAAVAVATATDAAGR